MSGFLYFVEGQQNSIQREDLAAAGLGYAFEGPPRFRGCAPGPGGGPGLVCAADESTKLGYFADRQTWRQIPGSRHWLGWYQDDLPTPEALARKEQLDGHYVTLADERPWLAPIARGWTEFEGEARWYCNLPQRSGLDEQGHWTSQGVLRKHEPLWQLALAYWDDLYAAMKTAAGDDGEHDDTTHDETTHAITFEFAGLHEAAVEVLAANYRIGAIEADVLGLLTVSHCRDILGALIDQDGFRELVKKKSPAAGSSTAAGAKDDCPDIGPPSPT